MHWLTHFFFAVRGPHPAFQKPLLSSYTRGLPAGAFGVGLRVSAHSCPPGENQPASPPGAGLSSTAVLAPGPTARRRGAAGNRRGAGAPGEQRPGGRSRAADRDRLRIASRAGTGSTHPGRAEAARKLSAPGTFPETDWRGETVSVAPSGMQRFITMMSGAGFVALTDGETWLKGK